MTCTGPTGPGGAVAVIWVAETTVNDDAVLPKRTALALVRLVPVRVTVFPPETGPWFGASPVRLGAAREVTVALRESDAGRRAAGEGPGGVCGLRNARNAPMTPPLPESRTGGPVCRP
ncbi:hypothetical protein GCM10020000_83830 [Streptomyces olivoverticillatus]